MKTVKRLIVSRAKAVKKSMGKFFGVAALLTLTGAMVNTASATVIVGNCALTTITDVPAVVVSSDCQPRPALEPAPLIGIDYQLVLAYEGYLEFANRGTQVDTLPSGSATIQIRADDEIFNLLLDTSSSFAIPEATLSPGDSFRALFNGTLTAIGSIAPSDFGWLPGEPFTIGAWFSDFIGEPSVGDCRALDPVSCIQAVNALMTVSLEGEFTYTYEDTANPVPAPAALALFGLGLAVLGFSRYKKG